jgi:hypothetical protein
VVCNTKLCTEKKVFNYGELNYFTINAMLRELPKMIDIKTSKPLFEKTVTVWGIQGGFGNPSHLESLVGLEEWSDHKENDNYKEYDIIIKERL